MLNQDVLAQLRQLKQTIHESKDRGEGVVKGSQGRFGFVALDDGREIYLPPEQMQRVFPDDRIAIEVITGAEGSSPKGDKPAAQLERLLESPLRTFTGRYVIRDNAHFVEPDLPRLSRWIFVPPKSRRVFNQSKSDGQSKVGAQPKHGDYVRASITQHPFNDGKPQARIDAIIGNDAQKGVEARYALARFNLPDSAPTLVDSDLAQPDFNARRDFTALPLVTIDGAETRDMDDALFAESIALDDGTTGWKLTVAIADPSAWINPGSALEKTIAARGTSVYLPGLSVPMLPEQLANERCSLQPDVERLALVCEIWIDNAGRIARYEFSEARVRSHAKLSYEHVAEFLSQTNARDADNGEINESSAWAESLRALHAASASLQQQRQRDHILLPERGEYRAQLDSNGKIAGYQRQQKNSAHQLVEECMIATNRCAADFLRADGHAVFVNHAGFRSERRENIDKLLAAELPDFAQKDVAALPNYIALMQAFSATPAAVQHELPLREILTRSLERSQFSTQAAPHFGLGFECYATITSPIRKFNDYLSQRAIKNKLRNEKVSAIKPETIVQIQDCNDRTRQAANFVQQWLDCDYLAKQESRTWNATIVHVTSSGFLVKLNDNGIQGFVDTRHSGEKFSFDSVYMRLSSATRSYQLEQLIEVSVAAIDTKKRQVALQLATVAAPIPATVAVE